MRDIVWRIGFTLTALVVLAVLGPSVGCNRGKQIVEQILGETPTAKVAGYLDAIAKGDRQAALARWSLADSSGADLKARRESVTDALLACGPRLGYRILGVEWWRTCCEPGVIDDPDEAGGARVRVAVGGEDRPEAVYMFDLIVPGGYWGDAAGNPVRRWVIMDVYPEGAAPLVWTWGE